MQRTEDCDAPCADGKPERKVEIYTDGGCSPNPGPGGWGAILRYGENEKELSGSAPRTTNNRMELTAVVEALRAIKRPCRLAIHTDSRYLKDGITNWILKWKRNGWKTSTGTPVKNKDLWIALDEASRRAHHRMALGQRTRRSSRKRTV